MTKTIQGLEDYSYDEIIDLVNDFIIDRIWDSGHSADDIKLTDIRLHGSRLRGQARDDSDLDAVVEYDGDIIEDDFFSILNDEDPLYIDDVRVDINPIQENMTDYMKRSNAYDKKMLGESYNKISKIKLLENKIKVFEDILKNKRNSAKMNKQSDKELTLEEKVARLERLADSYSAKKRTNEDISSDLSDSLKSIVEFKEIITRLSKMDVNKFVNTISNVSSIIQQDNTVDTNNISKEIKSLKDSSSKVLSSLDEMLNMVTQSAANIASITNILSKVRV